MATERHTDFAAAAVPGLSSFIGSRTPSFTAVDQATLAFQNMSDPFPPRSAPAIEPTSFSLDQLSSSEDVPAAASLLHSPKHNNLLQQEPTLSEGSRPFALALSIDPPSSSPQPPLLLLPLPASASAAASSQPEIVPATLMTDREMMARMLEEMVKMREGVERLNALCSPSVPAIIKARGKRVQAAMSAAAADDSNAPGARVPAKRKQAPPTAAAAATVPMVEEEEETKNAEVHPAAAPAAAPITAVASETPKKKRKAESTSGEDAEKRARKEAKKELKKAQKELEKAEQAAAAAAEEGDEEAAKKKKAQPKKKKAPATGLGYASSDDDEN